jgi:hypothetical protein
MYSEYSFIPPSTPVFAHPLLKNLKPTKYGRKEEDSVGREAEPSTSAVAENLSSSKANKFLDPLGAASNTIVLENGIGARECNGTVTSGSVAEGIDDATSR